MLIDLDAGQTGSGIISNAIAIAEKEPFQGQENGSLLQPHATAYKAMTASTQFTFTCEPQTPGAIQWPGRFLDAAFPTTTALTVPQVALQAKVCQLSRHKIYQLRLLLAPV